MNKNFKDRLQARKSLEIKKKPNKQPKWLFPTNQEKQYDKVLYNLVNQIKQSIKKNLMPAIPSMINEVEKKMPNDRNDDYLDRLKGIMLFIRDQLQFTVNSSIVAAEIIGVEIAKFNKKQAEKFNASVFGIDIFVDEPWLGDQLKLFASQNAQLIQSLPDQELERVAGVVERGLQQGERFTDIAKDIQKSFGITRRRATLIARDQSTKLNSSLTRLRQEEVGVTHYIWQTSGDERVRPTHRANDGKKFKWDTPPKVTGHPGNDVNCRCVAIAVIDDLLK